MLTDTAGSKTSPTGPRKFLKYTKLESILDQDISATSLILLYIRTIFVRIESWFIEPSKTYCDSFHIEVTTLFISTQYLFTSAQHVLDIK